MAILEKILFYPVIGIDIFVQLNQSKDYRSLVMDNAGSFLPVIWGTCALNYISEKIFKKSTPYEYINPLIMTILMIGIEVNQKYSITSDILYSITSGTFDENDIYAGLLGGIASLAIGITSKYLGKRKEQMNSKYAPNPFTD